MSEWCSQAPDLIQLLMKLPQELFLFLFHNTENSGVGCEHLYVHFRTFVSLRVYWKVRTGWRCAGRVYKAGSVSALKRGSG